MPLAIEWVLIDCVDLDAMTDFWCRALDLEHVGTGPSGGHILEATDGSGRRLGLMPSASPKTGKNRVHFDLRPDDQEAEVRRLESLGACRIDVGQANVTWVVMADPEGNEFCVLRSAVRKAADRPQLDMA
jgi:predicted enzyme related to lactoylglutathione lyase